MKIDRVIRHTPTEVTIILRPSWFARLFGAKDLVCDLQYRGAYKGKHGIEDECLEWRSKLTGKKVGWMKHGCLLEYALEFHYADGCTCCQCHDGCDRGCEELERRCHIHGVRLPEARVIDAPPGWGP